MKKRCASKMCGVRQAGTLSKLLRKRHPRDRKSTRLNSSHRCISYAVFCLKKKKKRKPALVKRALRELAFLLHLATLRLDRVVLDRRLHRQLQAPAHVLLCSRKVWARRSAV